ncbi:MAG: VOC family protein [Methanobacteriota archaeon]
MYFTYTGIRVRDLDVTRRFYRRAMGMRVVNRGRMDAGGLFVHLRSPGSPQVLELNWYPPGTRFHEPYAAGSELDHLAFWCRDVRSDFMRLVGAGAEAAVEPWDEGRWTLAFVRDPDGIWIELIGRRPSRDRRGPTWQRRRTRH